MPEEGIYIRVLLRWKSKNSKINPSSWDTYDFLDRELNMKDLKKILSKILEKNIEKHYVLWVYVGQITLVL